MEVTATAPGKVFVVGEYAVARGAPAVVAAVDRRLGCRIRARRGSGSLSVQVGDRHFRTSSTRGSLEGVPAACRFVVAAVLVSAKFLDLSRLDLTVDTWSELDLSQAKLGLGSSAAAVAATTAALHGAVGREPPPTELARLGVAAHRLAQEGGSGADVVACTLGGIHRIEGLGSSSNVGTLDAPALPSLRVESMELPSSLALEVVATGQPVGTKSRVARFMHRADGRSALGEGGAAIVRAWCEGMVAAVDSFCDGCRNGDGAAVLRSVAGARLLMTRLGAVAGVGVWNKLLRQACFLPGHFRGCEFKPSGAGGGDCAIGLVPTLEKEEIRRFWSGAGLLGLGVAPSVHGVQLLTTEGSPENG